ncbi:MAG: SDR family oxidoreductase [Actinomycetota bacterium]|nr:SDR family oxidoreductase [Actinomycetota bacterium]
MTADRSLAVVTGAASGIGAALVARLEADGRRVVGIDVEHARSALAIRHDVGDVEAAEPLIETIEREHGPVIALANVAGIFLPQAVLALTLESLRRHLAVMLEGPIFLARAVAARMLGRGGGRIVNVSSIHASNGEPASLAYDVAKAGLEAATRSLAIELGSGNVLVNSVAPGFTRTPMSVVGGQDELETDDFRRRYLEGTRLPLGRAAAPEEVAEAIAWLLSDRNTYITGARVVVDGGLTATF